MDKAVQTKSILIERKRLVIIITYITITVIKRRHLIIPVVNKNSQRSTVSK